MKYGSIWPDGVDPQIVRGFKYVVYVFFTGGKMNLF